MSDPVQPALPTRNTTTTIAANTALHRLTTLLQRVNALHKLYVQRRQLHEQLAQLFSKRTAIQSEYTQKQQYINAHHRIAAHIKSQRQYISQRKDEIDVVNNELIASRKHTLHNSNTHLHDHTIPQLHSTITQIESAQQHYTVLKRQVRYLQQHKCMNLIGHVYTIQPSKLLVSNIVHTAGIYSIRQYKLPIKNLHTFQCKHVDTAIGYTAHLTQLLSKYLNIPLPYPIQYIASTCTITDSDTNTVLPLYVYNASDLRLFEAGCVLLWRDVQHMCATYIGSDVWNKIQTTMVNDSSVLQCLFVLLRHVLPT